MKVFTGFLLLPGICAGLVRAQTCAPPGVLRPTDSVQASLSSANCRLPDGSVFADYLVTFPRHGTVQVAGASGDFKITLTLTDSAGRKLAAGATVQAAVEAGDYHVMVRSPSANQAGNFTLQTAFQPEPGTLCRAYPRVGMPPAGVTTTVTGQLGPSSCALPDGSLYDGYQLTIYGSGTLTLSLNSSYIDAYLILRTADGNALASDDNGGGGTNAQISVSVLGNATYTIVAASNSAGGAYQLLLNYVPDAGATCASAKTFTNSDQANGTIDEGSCSFNPPNSFPFQFFDITVGVAGLAQFQVQSATFAPLMLLMDASGNPIAQDAASGGAKSPVIRQQVAPGSYRLLVFDESSASGTFSLQYSFSPGLPEICPVLTLNSGGASGSLSGTSSCRSGNLMAGDYQIVLPASGTLDLNLSSGDFTTALELRDAQGNLLTVADDSQDGSSARILADLPAGTYTAVAASFDVPGGYNIAYAFTQKALTPCSQLPTLALNSGYIGLLGSNNCVGSDGRSVDYYQFTTAADGTVGAFMTSGQLDSFLKLTDVNGNVLRTDDNSYIDRGAAIQQYLPAGTYRLEARSNSGNGLYRVDVLYSQGGRPGFCAPQPVTAATNGVLGFSSCQYVDNTFADLYFFAVPDGGQAASIQLSSADFDAFLILLDSKGNVIASDDNSGGGTDALIVQNLDPATYYVVAKPAGAPSSSGKYALSVTTAPLVSSGP